MNDNGDSLQVLFNALMLNNNTTTLAWSTKTIIISHYNLGFKFFFAELNISRHVFF
jgi:hypothetical protein